MTRAATAPRLAPPDAADWLTAHGGAAFTALSELIVDVAVIVVDHHEVVLAWSPEARRLTGYDGADVVGRPCPEGLLRGPGGPHPFGAAVAVRRADGGVLWVRQRSTVVGAAVVHTLTLDPTAHLDPTPSDTTELHGCVTRDPAMARALQLVRSVAATDATVLLRGEPGTGKATLARSLHLESARHGGPFVVVRCGELSPATSQQRLFGPDGAFAHADGGTLFLDEVGELPLEAQDHLLAALDGAGPYDVRLVAATHRPLRDEVRAGRFREALMRALRVVPVYLPALRQRPLDVDLMVRRCLNGPRPLAARQVRGVDADAMRLLLDHPWPGNVRELLNVLEYALTVTEGPAVTAADLPAALRDPRREPAPVRTLPSPDDAERVRGALEDADGDIDRAAAMLGVSRTTFWRMRKRSGMV